MTIKPKLLAAAIAAALSLGAATAHAELARVGPVNPAHGYPEWYQDKTGLALDLCLPKNQAQLDSGLCLILPADVPGGSAPESFPTTFADEHFWWAANALLNTNSATAGLAGGRASLVLGLEAAFGLGPVVPGDQISFGRIRVKITDLPSAGTYKVIHPYGVETFEKQAGEAIFFTDDVGFQCAQGQFDCALGTRIGPFLLPATSPGGASKPFITVDGDTYISDGVDATAVNGSPFGTNVFRIEGPNIGGPGVDFIETSLFTLIGRVHSQPIASPMRVDRASYSRGTTTGAKVDVFASASASIGTPAPNLSYLMQAVDPAGGAPTATGQVMTGSTQGHFWGQSALTNPATLPAEVTVINNSDTPVSFVTANLVDDVKITAANWDSASGTLTVSAQSSDQYAPPRLFVDLSGYLLAPATQELVGGSATVSGLTVAPPTITVISSAGGRTTVPLHPLLLAASQAQATNDATATLEDTPAVIDVGANDVNAMPGTLAILGNPFNGTVSVNPVATDPVTGADIVSVTYTPKANYSGTDSFTYTVRGVDGLQSNVATVTVTVGAVNDVPVANPDSACAIPGFPQQINVAANDSDVDGNLLPSSVAVLSGPTYGTASAAGGAISYNPPAALPPGQTTVNEVITYQIADSAGAVATSTLTMKLYPVEGITVARAQFTRSGSKWVIDGTSTIACGQTVTAHNGPTLAGAVIGRSPVDILGAWQIQVPGSTIQPDGTRTISVETTIGGKRLSFPVSIK